jgi:hypothetical protein
LALPIISLNVVATVAFYQGMVLQPMFESTLSALVVLTAVTPKQCVPEARLFAV